MPGAPSGSRLPRKTGTSRRTREALESIAFQIGLVIAIERNRVRKNQTELAEDVGHGADQNDISRIERGIPTGFSAKQVKRLFKVLEMSSFRLQREFLIWWQSQKP